MNVVWTEKELQFIKDNANKLTDKNMTALLNKARMAVGKTCITLNGLRGIRQRKLGIKKSAGRSVARVISVSVPASGILRVVAPPFASQ